MNRFYISLLLCAITHTISFAQMIQTDTFVIVGNATKFRTNGPGDAGNLGILNGNNYVIQAYLLPGNYLNDTCPGTLNCGILADGKPADSTIVIGDWDCRGFFTLDFNQIYLEGGTFDNSVQTFRFYPGKQNICPAGCTISTEGPVTTTSISGTDPNVWYERIIAGGTKDVKFIRGKTNVISYQHDEEANASGSVNSQVIFQYQVQPGDLTFEKQLDVSVNGLSLIWYENMGSLDDQYGSTLFLEGVIYPGGTFANHGASSGMDVSGNPQFSPIGKWSCRGWWFSEDKEYNPAEGFFALTQQTFEFEDPVLGQVQISTEGRDFIGMNESVEKAVVGATNALKGHRGACMETLAGINESKGFNFTYNFDTKVVLGTKEELAAINAVSMSLYPNPARDRLTVQLDRLENNQTYSLQLTDAGGRILYSEPVLANVQKLTVNLNIGAYPEGWYAAVLKKNGLVLGSKGFTRLK